MDEEREELVQRERDLEGLREKAARLETDLVESRQRLLEWLAARGIGTPEEYREKRTERDRLVAEHEACEVELARALARWKCPSADELRRECERRLRALDEEIMEEELPEGEARKLYAAPVLLDGRIEELAAECSRLAASISEASGFVRESLGDIPDRLVRLERRIADTERVIAGIFGEIALDVRTAFALLAGEVAGLFGAVVPEARRVDIDDLDGKAIRAADAAGEMRTLDNLSRETRDAFLLATRLALFTSRRACRTARSRRAVLRI